MDLLLDLYGFVGVVLRAGLLTARTALLGSLAFWLLAALPLAPRLPPADAARLRELGRRCTRVAACATLGLLLLSGALNAAVLAGTLDAPLARVLGADFIAATALAAASALALAWLAANTAPGPARRATLVASAVVLLAAGAATAHAMARTEGRAVLLSATVLHQLGAALWVGGLPALALALRLSPVAAGAVGRRYSALAASGVALVLAGTLGFWWGYVGAPEAVWGTAYGVMAATKGALLLVMLALGAANFWLLHHLSHRVAHLPAARSLGAAAVAEGSTPVADALPRVRRFVECEAAIGLALLALAASLTSVPPASDLPDDRVTWAEITERFTPALPRMNSPDRADLAIPALQARLDAEWQARQDETRPQAFTPGEGLLPPRNAGDIAWSEYNHHWAGLLVFLVAVAALLDATGRVPIARHWPLLFLGLAAFVGIRSDPEAWPLGDIGLLESLRDPEVVQHKLAALLVVGFAVAEWSVRLGWLRGRFRFAFPLSMLAGGLLLLAHTHAVANVREALLIEISHLGVAVLAVLGSCARWTELRGPPALARPAALVWPVCLLLIGTLLLIYREA